MRGGLLNSFRGSIPAPTRDLDLSTLPTGIYLLRPDTKAGTTVRQLSIK
ncbi:MAG: T9SS type A sorting domain-containing protein [Hymenobacter sp.]|nr:MAG: T9SS type A sorting domain-containing protein [Hymenobacter sp.]